MWKFLFLVLCISALPDINPKRPVCDCNECLKQCEETPFKVYDLPDQTFGDSEYLEP